MLQITKVFLNQHKQIFLAKYHFHTVKMTKLQYYEAGLLKLAQPKNLTKKGSIIFDRNSDMDFYFPGEPQITQI